MYRCIPAALPFVPQFGKCKMTYVPWYISYLWETLQDHSKLMKKLSVSCLNDFYPDTHTNHYVVLVMLVMRNTKIKLPILMNALQFTHHHFQSTDDSISFTWAKPQFSIQHNSQLVYSFTQLCVIC